MALDGIVIAHLTKELQEALTGGKIAKIAQPENDELLLTIKNFKNQYPAPDLCRRQPSSDLSHQ